MNDLEGLESFLKKVDEITGLVKELNSPDVDVQQKAAEKADHLIAALEDEDEGPCKTIVNKTSINTNPSHLPPSASMASQQGSTESQALKEEGNKEFTRGDYVAAVKHYTAGLEELRDMQSLYTNRALAYIKLGKYDEAIIDCEWALKCNESCVKAYLYAGRAHQALKNFNEARSSYQKILEIEAGKEKMVKECLTQVDLEEEKEHQERSAREQFDQGGEEVTTVPQLLEKLSVADQIPLYYCGGMELLAHAITDCTGQTLFRLHNGFSVISDNDTVRKSLLGKSSAAHTQNLCVCVLRLWRVICTGNGENQKMLMESAASGRSVVDLLASESPAVRTASLDLLGTLAQTPRGRALAIDKLNLQRLLVNLMLCVCQPEQQSAGERTSALNILDEFAKEIKDDIIREDMASRGAGWEAFLVAMEQCVLLEHREILYPLLGLIINLSSVTSPAIQEHAVDICGRCLSLLSDTDGGIITRAAGVLSKVLPQSPAAVEHVVQGGVVRTLRRLLKGPGQTSVRFLVKALTVCTADSHLARKHLLKHDKRLSSLLGLLSPGGDESVSGNAALCLAHCLELEGTASVLLGTDVVLLLLRHATGDTAQKTAVQRNAAIALGKLCSAEPRHTTKLRELHGLEILHSCMKLVT
ncbi:tetratricopeptide repeat protein 12 [Aplochiton taeniatus]